MNSDDYKKQAEQHDREVVAMQAKVDQVQKNIEREKARFEADISAAQAQIDRILPYKDDNIEHAKEITDWEARISQFEQQRDREIMRIESELQQHMRALDDHQRESVKAWGAHKTTKAAEDRTRVSRAATRAQDPNQGSSADDYTLAA